MTPHVLRPAFSYNYLEKSENNIIGLANILAPDSVKKTQIDALQKEIQKINFSRCCVVVATIGMTETVMAIHNAPSHATTFFGRQSELNDLSELLTGTKSRLLSLTGLGGIGKSRLALALAGQIQHKFPDGVHFIPLQPLQSPNPA